MENINRVVVTYLFETTGHLYPFLYQKTPDSLIKKRKLVVTSGDHPTTLQKSSVSREGQVRNGNRSQLLIEIVNQFHLIRVLSFSKRKILSTVVKFFVEFLQISFTNPLKPFFYGDRYRIT